MRAIVVNCPHCGARLQVEDADVVTCEYCGTAARVQRRTRILERVMPPPEVGPPPIALQVAHPTSRWFVVAGVVGAFALTGAVAWGVSGSVKRAENQQKAIEAKIQAELAKIPSFAALGTPGWQGMNPAIVVDVNGDGTLDLLGRSTRTGMNEVRIVALDGVTHAPLWESELLGDYSGTFQGQLAVTGDVVLFATPTGAVRGFELATGAPRWTAKLDERVTQLCAGDEETFVVIGKDEVARQLRRASGEVLQTRPARGMTCASLPTDVPRDRGVRADALGRRHGLTLAHQYEGPGGRVLGGRRAKGTSAALLVALDESGAARWQAALAQEPLAAVEREPVDVVVGSDAVCAIYYGGSITEPTRVACFSLADGARRWDVEVADALSLAIHGPHLLVSRRGQLEGRDLGTGAVAWSFGPNPP